MGTTMVPSGAVVYANLHVANQEGKTFEKIPDTYPFDVVECILEMFLDISLTQLQIDNSSAFTDELFEFV